jgi:hypothetical protein
MEHIYARANELLSEPQTKDVADELLALKIEAESMTAHVHGHRTATGYVPYPTLDDPRFNELIFRKKEFNEHRAPPPVPKKHRLASHESLDAAWKAACSTGEFTLTPNQLFVRNFMSPKSPYNGVLLFHGVGSGKTCSAITIAEQFVDHMKHGVLVITRPGLKDGFRRNIYDVDKVRTTESGALDFDGAAQCTGTKYADMVRGRGAMGREQFEVQIGKIVKDRYRFMGPGEFAHVVAALGEGDAATERIAAAFSDTVLIVDEAHHLRGDDNKRVAPALKRVLRHTENVKLVLLTATPMFNRAADIVDLINILRANDKAKPLRGKEVFDKDGDFVAGGEQRLIDASRGYVSYMRGDSPFSYPLRLTPRLNRDHAVLKDNQMPHTDLKGGPIGKNHRIRDLVIVGCPLGRAQARVYRGLEERLRAYEDEEAVAADSEEGDDVQVDRKSSSASMLHTGQQVCNVVFPGPATNKYGKAGFDGAFARAGSGAGRELQVRYADATAPPFLAGAQLADHAPKIKAVVERVARCDGVAMVYTRWVWGGLVPLCIALEHAGFSRFEAPPMLTNMKGQGKGKGSLKYAVICGQREVASDIPRAIAALTSAANLDGSVVKVVLISDKGTEGLDLKFLREVHVLEPWYHLNKIEQIVGRASRHCSHAALPAAKRNVTVYLHAVVDLKGRETLDLRVYRMAEGKQRRIDHVERVLRNHSIDCNLNLPSLHFDRDALGLSVDVTTSQGTVIHGYKIGDDPSELPRCSPWLKGVGTNASTYDAGMHAYQRVAYARALRDLFARRVKATFEQCWEFVAARIPGAKRDAMSAALDDAVKAGATLFDANGRQGRMIYRANVYLFQPDDEDTVLLSDEEREKPAGSPYPLRLTLDRVDATDVTTGWDVDSFDVAFRRKVAAMAASLPCPAMRFRSAIVDAQVDRMSEDEILTACSAVLTSAARGVATDVENEVLRSLVARGVLARAPDGKWVARVADATYCFEKGDDHLRKCVGAKGPLAKDPLANPLGVMIRSSGEGASVFHVVVGGVRVRCDQLPSAEVERLARSAVGKTVRLPKKELGNAACLLLELALRVAGSLQRTP